MLKWNWKDKMGEAVYKQPNGLCKCNIYACNGLFASVWENDKEYQLYDFAVDKAHLKRILKHGTKYIHSVKLNTFFKSEVRAITSAIIESKQQVKIQFYYKEIK